MATLWVFQIFWHIECSTFIASSFRFWNSSAGIPSPPPPPRLFIVMLYQADLTSHSRMSGSRWVITSLWISGPWRSFLYSSSVYSWYYFLISSASVRSIPFLCFIVSIFALIVPLVSLISFNGSLVFPILFFFSISLHWWLRKAFYLSWLFFGTVHSDGYIFPFLLCFSSLLYSTLCKASSTNHFAFFHFFFLGMVLITASYTMWWTSIHSSSGTVCIKCNPLNLFVTSTV